MRKGVKKKAVAVACSVAVSACNFEVQAASGNITTIQVTPAGEFRPQDGRKLDVPAWRIDAASAQNVISRFKQRATPLVIDYEHQTLRKEANGQPAPAAAWFRNLEWREGKGLFAEIELTDGARQAIANREYLFFSPVFRYHPRTGEVLEVLMGAITNTPAVDGMDEVSLMAAACFGATLEDDPVSEYLKKLLAKFGLEAETDEQAVAVLSAHFDQLTDNGTFTAVCSALGVKPDTDEETLVAACTALKAKADSGQPDPAQYVPVSAVSEMQKEIAALNSRLNDRDTADADALVNQALEDGRIAKCLEPWARDLAKKDVAALNQYLKAATPIAQVLASQTNGESPVTDNEHGLTAAEIAVCNNMGITQEAFVAAKAS